VLVLPILFFLASVASKYKLGQFIFIADIVQSPAQIPPIILEYIANVRTAYTEEMDQGQLSIMRQLYRIPSTLFPLLITVVVTAMSGV
jgi:hypothetical protein